MEAETKTVWSGAVFEITTYLNVKTGSAYRPAASTTRRPIEARLNEGYNPRDFEAVIDLKCRQWLGNETMDRYLRPCTLFGNRFRDYLEEAHREKQRQERGFQSASGHSGAGFRKGLLDD